MNIDLIKGEAYHCFCPECNEKLTFFAPCPLYHGELITLFLDKNVDFRYCIGICNRVDCSYAEIRSGDELRAFSIELGRLKKS